MLLIIYLIYGKGNLLYMFKDYYLGIIGLAIILFLINVFSINWTNNRIIKILPFEPDDVTYFKANIDYCHRFSVFCLF